MAEEIKVGDWISYRVSGLTGRGKVTRVDDETYTVKPADLSGGSLIWGVTTTLAKGYRVKKIAPPEGE